MPWGFRKSVKMGPLRMTFSKSGISTSVGVRGARMTVGPRGTYVTVGAGGIYYRQKVGGSSAAGSTQPNGHQPRPQQETGSPAPAPETNSVETVDMASLVATSGDDVAREIHDRWQKTEWSKATLWTAIILGLAGFGNAVMFMPAILLGAATWHLRNVEMREKTVSLTYSLDPIASAAYSSMFEYLEQLAASHKLWSIVTATETKDYKRNAGASNLIQRKPVSLSKAMPRFLETNVAVYALTAGPYRLYFLPDRLLVQANGAVSAIPYARLTIQGEQTRFIENAGVPHDTQVVAQTWRYVNKNGGPDRRFTNNQQLPVCLYGEVKLSSLPGLRIELQCSNPALADCAQESFSSLCSLSATRGELRNRP